MASERSVEAPGQFSFQPKEWPAWKRRYEAYHTLTKLSKESEDFQICSLMYIMGDRAYELLSTFNLSDEESKKYKKVLDAFEKHFVGKRNVVYDRAMFNSRDQQEWETIEEYVTVLYTLSEHCEYGTIREDLIRDRIVLGVQDKGLSQKLMLDSPNLQKAVEIARRFESVKRDHAEISGDKPKLVVDRVQKPSGKKNHPGRKENVGGSSVEPEEKSACYQCGREGHGSADKERCPAANSVCFKCEEPGHLAKMCRNKAVRLVEESSPVKAFFSVSLGGTRRGWEAEMLVNQAPIIFKLDTGADAIIVPYSNWKKDLPGQKLKSSTVILQGPNGAKLDCVGMFEAELCYKRRRIREDVYVVEGVSTPLLGLSACEDLGLLKRLFEVASPVNPKAVKEEESMNWGMEEKLLDDRQHHAMDKDVSVGEKVWVKDRSEWGVVTKKADPPWSFLVKTASGEFIRKEFHLEPVGVQMQEEDIDYFAANSDEEHIQEEEPRTSPEVVGGGIA